MEIMKAERTTVRLPASLLSDAKKYAAETGRTLTSLMQDALIEVLARKKKPRKRKRITLPDYDLGPMRPGLSLDHNASIQEFFDQEYIEKLRRLEQPDDPA